MDKNQFDELVRIARRYKTEGVASYLSQKEKNGRVDGICIAIRELYGLGEANRFWRGVAHPPKVVPVLRPDDV